MVGQKSPKQGRFVRSKGDTVQRMSRGIQKGRKQGHFGRWGVGVGLCVMMLVAACDPPGKKACSEDRQCSMGEYCDPKDNRCAVGCSDDSRCATGEACHKNKCKLRICTPDATNTPPNGEPCYTGNPADISEVIQKAGGTCRQGRRYCIDNGQAWSVCYLDVLPVPEICDGKDNDCNGKIDDGTKDCECTPKATRPCSTSPVNTKFQTQSKISFCRQGVQRCTEAGKWGVCEHEIRPHTDLPLLLGCQVRDADCNGILDEGCACKEGESPRACKVRLPGLSDTCATNTGVVAEGTQACEKSCLDSTKTTCEGAGALFVWGACMTLKGNTKVGLTLPSPEDLHGCDGLDNDCDGQVDNRRLSDGSSEPLSRPCFTGGGGCEEKSAQKTRFVCQGLCAPGLQFCDAAKKAWSDECKGVITPQKETCDGKDNDCDGQIDNLPARPCYEAATGCTKEADGRYSCVSPCRGGLQSCINGAWESCKDQVLPKPEEKGKATCSDGLDNDCNGTKDNEDAACQ